VRFRAKVLTMSTFKSWPEHPLKTSRIDPADPAYSQLE
jgi:hypothetical protein